MALQLAQEGVNVALLARTVSDLEAVATEIKALGVKALVISADVADIDSVNKAVSQVENEFGYIDILINNAGIASFGKFLELTPTDWEKIVQVNLLELTT